MKARNLLLGFCLANLTQASMAASQVTDSEKQEKTEKTSKETKKSRFTMGGYGEAVMTRNFFSDKYLRYTDAETYKDDKSHEIGRASCRERV